MVGPRGFFELATTSNNPMIGESNREAKKYPQNPNLRWRPNRATTMLATTTITNIWSISTPLRL